jgi:hypothetical protein
MISGRQRLRVAGGNCIIAENFIIVDIRKIVSDCLEKIGSSRYQRKG